MLLLFEQVGFSINALRSLSPELILADGDVVSVVVMAQNKVLYFTVLFNNTSFLYTQVSCYKQKEGSTHSVYHIESIMQ